MLNRDFDLGGGAAWKIVKFAGRNKGKRHAYITEMQ